MPSLKKQILRHKLLTQRQALSTASQQELSQRICHKIAGLTHYHEANYIGMYQSINREVDLNTLRTKASDDAKLACFPVMNEDKTLSFFTTNLDTLFHNNRYNIPEPSSTKRIEVEKLDILCIPLLAFDQYGNRIGMGGGYYDRTLSTKRSRLVLGVAYDFQCQERIEADAWDIALDAIVTESGIIWAF